MDTGPLHGGSFAKFAAHQMYCCLLTEFLVDTKDNILSFSFFTMAKYVILFLAKRRCIGALMPLILLAHHIFKQLYTTNLLNDIC